MAQSCSHCEETAALRLLNAVRFLRSRELPHFQNLDERIYKISIADSGNP